MNRATLKMRNLAKRLIDYEAKGNKFSTTKPSLPLPAVEKLRPHLTTLMGSAGFRALFARSIALARAEVDWLGQLRVKADGTVEGWEKLHSQLEPQEIFKGRVVLLAHLLELLVTFIGEHLTLQMVGEFWPKLPPENPKPGKGLKK